MISTDLEKLYKDFRTGLEIIVNDLELKRRELHELNQAAHEEVRKAATIKKEQDQREQHMREEKNYLIKLREDLKQKELALAGLREKEIEDDKRKMEMELKKNELIAEQKKLTDLKAKEKELQDKLEEMKTEKALIEKEKAIDAERKALLDARERAIKQTEERLKRFT